MPSCSCNGWLVCHLFIISFIKSLTSVSKFGCVVNSAIGSGEGERRMMQICSVFHAPSSFQRKSSGGVKFHRIRSPVSPPKMVNCVHTFWKHDITSCLFSSFLLCRKSSLYASMAQYFVFRHAFHSIAPRWKCVSLNATSTLWHQIDHIIWACRIS